MRQNTQTGVGASSFNNLNLASPFPGARDERIADALQHACEERLAGYIDIVAKKDRLFHVRREITRAAFGAD